MDFYYNIFFRFGRLILKVVTFGTVRLENPNQFQMFIVALFGFIMVFPIAYLLLKLVLEWR